MYSLIRPDTTRRSSLLVRYFPLAKSVLPLPMGSTRDTYLIPISQNEFIEIHNNNEFDEIISKFSDHLRTILAIIKTNNRINKLRHQNNMAKRYKANKYRKNRRL